MASVNWRSGNQFRQPDRGHNTFEIPPRSLMSGLAPFRLTTYNVKCFPWQNPPIRKIVDWITRNTDIVALQEVWCRHAHWSAAFAAHGWTFLRPSRESHFATLFGSGLAIAWRSTEWSLQDTRLYPYVSGIGFDVFAAKGWFRVELQQKATGAPLRLINTHMQSDYEFCGELWRPIAESIRMSQTNQLMEIEEQMPAMPTLVTGDMNTETCWFRSCEWFTQHSGPTYPGTAQILDHCVALPFGKDRWLLHDHRVGRETEGWSDHWPVCWRLQTITRENVKSSTSSGPAMLPAHRHPKSIRPRSHRSPDHTHRG